MGGFYCPTCEMVRHIEDHDDPREDCCWVCKTRVPYTEEELARMDADLADVPWEAK
jgi:hypothetical protein